MANLDYAWQKLYQAVSSMACDDRPLKDRLRGAYLSVHTLTADDFPDELQADFKNIETSLEAGADTISDEEVRDIIKALCSLYDKVARRLPRM